MVITLASCCLVFAGCGDKNPTVTLDKRNGEPIDTIQMQSQTLLLASTAQRTFLRRPVRVSSLRVGLAISLAYGRCTE